MLLEEGAVTVPAKSDGIKVKVVMVYPPHMASIHQKKLSSKMLTDFRHNHKGNLMPPFFLIQSNATDNVLRVHGNACRKAKTSQQGLDFLGRALLSKSQTLRILGKTDHPNANAFPMGILS